MKAWILIGFYLLKDIWKRWFETPGGVLSRLLVACILGLLLLVIDAAFMLSSASIQRKISLMGVRTIVLTRSVGGQESVREGDRLLEILAPLRSSGELLRLRQAGETAEDELGGKRTVRVYGKDMLRPLADVVPPSAQSDVLVVTDGLPTGMATSVRFGTSPAVEAVAIPAPGWLTKLGSGGLSVLVSAEAHPELLDGGFFEVIVFLGNESVDLPKTEAEIQLMLELEDLGNVQIASPQELLEELDRLETTQQRWQSGFGIFGGVAVALIFGSIAILEYRQNRFIIALLKSFGAPAVLLVARYLLEALLLVAISGLLARSAAIRLHPVVFGAMGIEPNLLDRAILDPYLWAAVWPQLRWLGLGALLSVLPVAFAIRTPVGKILA